MGEYSDRDHLRTLIFRISDTIRTYQTNASGKRFSVYVSLGVFVYVFLTCPFLPSVISPNLVITLKQG